MKYCFTKECENQFNLPIVDVHVGRKASSILFDSISAVY